MGLLWLSTDVIRSEPRWGYWDWKVGENGALETFPRRAATALAPLVAGLRGALTV